MSRLSSSQIDFAEAETSLRRIAELVGNCIGHKFTLHTYSFIGASSGLTCWRAFIAEPGVEFVSAKQFPWVPAASSREDAVLRLFSHCLDFFEVDSLEELELKLAVFSRKTVESMLGIKERP
jgi:hypothetical protein